MLSLCLCRYGTRDTWLESWPTWAAVDDMFRRNNAFLRSNLPLFWSYMSIRSGHLLFRSGFFFITSSLYQSLFFFNTWTFRFIPFFLSCTPLPRHFYFCFWSTILFPVLFFHWLEVSNKARAAIEQPLMMGLLPWLSKFAAFTLFIYRGKCSFLVGLSF